MGQWPWIILDTNSELHFVPHHTKILVKYIYFPREGLAFPGFVCRYMQFNLKSKEKKRASWLCSMGYLCSSWGLQPLRWSLLLWSAFPPNSVVGVSGCPVVFPLIVIVSPPPLPVHHFPPLRCFPPLHCFPPLPLPPCLARLPPPHLAPPCSSCSSLFSCSSFSSSSSSTPFSSSSHYPPHPLLLLLILLLLVLSSSCSFLSSCPAPACSSSPPRSRSVFITSHPPLP